MLDAERSNREQAACFVYREDIRFREIMPDGATRAKDWVTYEVTMLEGEPYHRRVAMNGGPLPPDDESDEEKRYRQVEAYRQATPMEERRKRYFAAEENRFRIDAHIVLEWHNLKRAEDSTLAGRAVWVVEAAPQRGAPKPKRRSQWSLSQRLRFWVDKTTSLPLQIEGEQLYDFDGSRKGTVTRVTYTEVEGVSLLARIDSLGSRGSGKAIYSFETDQTYSNYRRFRAESVLWFEKPNEP